MSNPTALVQKLWNHCNPAAAGRDDGFSSADYVDQLIFLLLLNMPDEHAISPYLSEAKRRDTASTIPEDKDGPTLLAQVVKRLISVEELRAFVCVDLQCAIS